MLLKQVGTRLLTKRGASSQNPLKRPRVSDSSSSGDGEAQSPSSESERSGSPCRSNEGDEDHGSFDEDDDEIDSNGNSTPILGSDSDGRDFGVHSNRETGRGDSIYLDDFSYPFSEFPLL